MSEKQKEQIEDPIDPALKIKQGDTSEKVEAILKTASETGQEVSIEGREQKIRNTLEAYRQYRESFRRLEMYLPDYKIKEDMVVFRNLPGEAIGEEREGELVIDPVLLLHPTYRIANILSHVIAHEELHKQGIKGDGWIEWYLQKIDLVKGDANGDIQLTDEYENALNNTSAFIEMLSHSTARPQNEIGEIIHNLYLQEDYTGMFNFFKNNCIDTFDSQEDKDKAFDIFHKAFPELRQKDSNEEGETIGVIPIIPEEGDLPQESSGIRETVKARVDEQLEEI